MKCIRKILIALAAGALLAGSAGADLITGISIKQDDGTLPNVQMTSTDAVDGQGLPSNTPALTGTHSATWNQHWFSSIVTGAFITVDLGANYELGTIHIWNENEDNAGRLRGLKDARIYVSPDENIANLVALTTDGSGTHDNVSSDFLFPIGEGLTTYTGFDLDLSGVTNASLLNNVRLVKIETITNYGNNGGSGLAEVQFGSVVAPGPTTLFQLTIAPNDTNPGNYDFAWPSLDGKLYDLVSSTSLSTAPGTWSVWQGNSDIGGAAPTNTLENVLGGAEARRFFAVIEKDPPPPPE